VKHLNPRQGITTRDGSVTLLGVETTV